MFFFSGGDLVSLLFFMPLMWPVETPKGEEVDTFGHSSEIECVGRAPAIQSRGQH